MKENNEKILQAEICHWNEIAGRKDKLNDVVSYKDYLSNQNLVWKKIHSLAFELCGRDLTDKKVLDFGCGRGISTVILAEKGATVTALDLSQEMVEVTLRRAELAGQIDKVTGLSGDFSILKSKAEKYDIIFAGAVLHHLPNFRSEISFLSSMLNDDGLFVSYDPFSSILFDFIRRYIPYNGKHRSKDENPLNIKHYKQIQRIFGKIELYPFGPFTAVERFIMSDSERLWKVLENLDRLFFTGNLFAWHMVCVAKK